LIGIQGRISRIRFAGHATEEWLALGISALVLCGLILWGQRIGWLPWASDCSQYVTYITCYPAPGETLSSRDAGENYIEDGTGHWLIQRVGPYLYTHNVNIGALVYYLFARFSPHPFVPAVLMTIVAFCMGLYYAYLFVRQASGSALFALIFLALLAGEYYFNLVFAVNLIRGWHWLALFGSGYHLLRWLEEGQKKHLPHIIAFLLCTVIGFMVGYDFLVFAFFLAALLILATKSSFSLRVRLTAVLLVYAIPFLLRQLQIIGGLGFDFWTKDLYYSAVIKTSFLHSHLIYFPLPPMRDIDKWYLQHHVLRPFAVPDDSLSHIARGFLQYVTIFWTPYLGVVTLGVVVVGGVVAAGFTGLGFLGLIGKGDSAELDQVMMAAKTVALVGGAETLGLYFFAPLSVEIYMHHRFPMIISFVLLAYAFVIYAMVWITRMGRGRDGWPRIGRRVTVTVLIFLAVYRVLNIVADYRVLTLTSPPADLELGK